MTPERLEEIKIAWAEFLGKHWFWRFSKNAKSISLEDNRGNIVMDLIRFGMNGAKPRFNVNGLMRDADNYAKLVDGREHHESWFQTIDEPTANAIASSPQHINELIEAVESLQKEREELVGLLRWVLDSACEYGDVVFSDVAWWTNDICRGNAARIREILGK